MFLKTFSILILAASTVMAANNMKLDTGTSQVTWKGSKKFVNSAHNGTLKLKAGEVTMDAGKITGGSFEIDMATLANDDLKADPDSQKKLVGHLQSADFFDVAKFPTAKFKITSVKETKGSKEGTHEITGELTLKDQTQPVTFPATVKIDKASATATATMVIDRTKWKLVYGSDSFIKGLVQDRIIKDQIEIGLNLTAKK
jgi:polyisoprenoid-binding protein YceI